MSFAANLAGLPDTAHLVRVELRGPDGTLEMIENRPGSQGSVRVYAYLAGKYGALNAEAARAGLTLYAEHTADAESHPGKHPNIDRLFSVAAGGQGYRILCIQA